MAGREERKSYIIVRMDGLVVHAKPITREEARWLWDAYYDVKDRRSRIMYLEEYGNVMDAGGYVRRLVQQLEQQQLEEWKYNPHFFIGRIYENPDDLVEDVRWLLGRRNLPPGARQALEELLDRVEEFLRRPVEPRPVDAPVRYLETNRPHVTFGLDGAVLEVTPRPEWLSYRMYRTMYWEDLELYGVSVFEDSLWLWWQVMHDVGLGYVRAVAVRRDASDGDAVAAVANDAAVQGFLRRYGKYFRELVMEREAELIDKGYADVVRKVKVALGTLELLDAGRREEAPA